MLYVGSKQAKLYRGDHAPASLYVGSTKVAGWKTETVSGASFTVQGTYKAPIDSMTIRGDVYGNGSQTPGSPASLTFASNPTVTIGDQSVTLPYTLRATLKADIESGASIEINCADEIVMTGGAVVLNTYIHDFAGFQNATYGAGGGMNNMNAASNQTAFFASMNEVSLLGSDVRHDTGACSHFNGVKSNIIDINGSFWRNPRIFFIQSGATKYIGFGVARQTLLERYGAYNATTLQQWAVDQNAAGTPLTLYYATSAPTVTDITETATGQALLALSCTAGSTSFAIDKGSLEVTVKAVDI